MRGRMNWKRRRDSAVIAISVNVSAPQTDKPNKQLTPCSWALSNNCLSHTQEILWKLISSHHVHNSPPFYPILSYTNHLHISPFYFFHLHFNIIFWPMLNFSKRPLSIIHKNKPTICVDTTVQFVLADWLATQKESHKYYFIFSINFILITVYKQQIRKW